MEKGETESSSFRRPLSDFNSPLRKIRHPPPPRLHYHHGFCRSLYPLCPPLPPSLSLSRSLSHFARVYVRVYLSPSLRPPPLVSRLRAPRKMLMLYWWQRWSALTVLRASAAAAAPHKKKFHQQIWTSTCTEPPFGFFSGGRRCSVQRVEPWHCQS